MSLRARLLLAVTAIALLGAAGARADCSGGACIPGGGPAAADCQAEFFGTGLALNYPPHDPASPQPKTALHCYDGDAGCDADGAVDGTCTFNVNVCLANDDPNLADCAPASVDRVKVKAKGAKRQSGTALKKAARALVPASAAACTAGQQLAVRIKKGLRGRKAKTAVVTLRAESGGTRDDDTLTLVCHPREWPGHGYDQRNTRATPRERRIKPKNVAKLQAVWELPLERAVASTPAVGHGLVFVTSFDGHVRALDPDTGDVVWAFDADVRAGIQSSPTLTADGRLLFGDPRGRVHALEARTGRLLWQTEPLRADDHFWSSPTVANDRVIYGHASHSDNPCAQGRLFGFDLDTGAQLWELKTVPDKICDTDTAIECTVDGDCPEGGTCIDGIGGGITATVAVDETGENVYMNTVGCYKFPSIGDSDAIFRLKAATGEVVWKTRVDPPEQFGYCQDDPTVECGTDAFCTTGICQEKNNYHDFGFLNGPIIIDTDAGSGGARRLIVSGSKNGTLYALDSETGDIVWKNVVRPTPVSPHFAAFGLFNGAIGYADGILYAVLNALSTGSVDETFQAYSIVDGSLVWSDDVRPSWGDVTIANGVVFGGTQFTNEYYAYDAATGERLATFVMPPETTVAGGAAIVDGRMYIGYGVFRTGGVRAYALK